MHLSLLEVNKSASPGQASNALELQRTGGEKLKAVATICTYY